mgnify:CR=1 FL=1
MRRKKLFAVLPGIVIIVATAIAMGIFSVAWQRVRFRCMLTLCLPDPSCAYRSKTTSEDSLPSRRNGGRLRSSISLVNGGAHFPPWLQFFIHSQRTPLFRRCEDSPHALLCRMSLFVQEEFNRYHVLSTEVVRALNFGRIAIVRDSEGLRRSGAARPSRQCMQPFASLCPGLSESWARS